MSIKLDPVITNSGRAAVVNAEGTGIGINLGFISLGDANGEGYSPTLGQTALKNQIMYEPITTGEKIDTQFYSQAEFLSTTALTVREVGVHLEDGTLFAVYSGDLPLTALSIGETFIARFDFEIADVNGEVVDFNVTHSFGYEEQISMMTMSLIQAEFITKNTLERLEMKGITL